MITFAGYSSERIDPGNKEYGLTNTPKVVAGMTEKCAALTELLYSRITSVDPVPAPRWRRWRFRGEHPSGQHRARERDGPRRAGSSRSTLEVIDAAKTKPSSGRPFIPGLGWGHCIKPDPLYPWKVKALEGQARFIELADEINGSNT